MLKHPRRALPAPLGRQRLQAIRGNKQPVVTRRYRFHAIDPRLQGVLVSCQNMRLQGVSALGQKHAVRKRIWLMPKITRLQGVTVSCQYTRLQGVSASCQKHAVTRRSCFLPKHAVTRRKCFMPTIPRLQGKNEKLSISVKRLGGQCPPTRTAHRRDVQGSK